MTRTRAFFVPLHLALPSLGLFFALGLSMPAAAQQNLVDDSGVIDMNHPYCDPGGPDDGCALESFAVLYDDTTTTNLDLIDQTSVTLDSFDDGWDAYVCGQVYQDGTLYASGCIGDDGNGVAAVGGNIAISGTHSYKVNTDSYYDYYLNGGCESGGTCVYVVSTTVSAMIGAPQINSVSPPYVFVGTGGTLTLNGLSFVNPFGGNPTTVSTTKAGGVGFTLSTGSVGPTQATASYSAALTATTGLWSIGMSYTLGGTILKGVFGSFTVGDPPPSITSVIPNSWTAGQSNIPVTIKGSYFGSNPQLTLVGAGATGSITSHTDTGQPGGATINASVSVPDACADGSVSITVTSTGYNGSGFAPAYAGESPSATSSATILTVGAPLTPDAPNILFNGTNVAGKTTTVVVGQKIKLTGQVPAQACVAVSSQQWSLPSGNAVGGWVATTQLGTAAAPPNDIGLASYGPFYWPVAGTFTMTYRYTLTNGQTSPTSSATFKVVGPTAAKFLTCGGNVPPAGCTAKAVLGKVAIDAGPVLEFGGPEPNIGIAFTASATPPTGFANSFVWVQLITNDAVTNTPSNGGPVQLCTPIIKPAGATFPGLDTQYPYDLINPTDDNPATATLTNANKQVSRTFSATMYLMWTSGLTGAVPVPLGSVNWKFTAAGKLTNAANNTWTVSSGSGTANAFVASSSYPGWTSFVPYTGQTCVNK